MLDLALPLPLVAPLALPASAAVAPAPSAPGAAPDGFVRALADASAGATAAPERQEIAAPGKIVLAALPNTSVVNGFATLQLVRPSVDSGQQLIADASGEPTPDTEAAAPDADSDAPTAPTPPPAILAFAFVPPIVPVQVVSTAPAVAAPATDISTNVSAVAASSTLPVTQAAPEAPEPDATVPDTASPSFAERRLSLKLDRSVEVIDAGATGARAPASASVDARPALRLVTQDTPPAIPLAVKADAVVASGTPQPAAHAFARAIALAQSKPTRLETPADVTDITTAAQAIAVGDARPVVLAPRALNTRREDWPQRLIDRVEAARDAANAGDTRIRLVPDALGKIDVALRQVGDTLHVHFTADQAATRDLLTQAQPRLAELAEARGLRLGQTGVDGGTLYQGGDQPRRPPIVNAPLANRPATAITAETTSASDDRIA